MAAIHLTGWRSMVQAGRELSEFAKGPSRARRIGSLGPAWSSPIGYDDGHWQWYIGHSLDSHAHLLSVSSDNPDRRGTLASAVHGGRQAQDRARPSKGQAHRALGLAGGVRWKRRRRSRQTEEEEGDAAAGLEVAQRPV